MFGISGTELFLIVAFVLIIFGPDKLPSFARTIGRFIGEFKRTQDAMEAQIRAEMFGGGSEGSGTSANRMKQAANASRAAAVPDEDDDEEQEEEE